MDSRFRSARAIILTAVPLGVLGDLLLRATPWGLNFPIWTAAFGTSVIAVARGSSRSPSVRPLLLALIAVFATLVAWRDAPFLVVWDFLAVVAALGLIAIEATDVRLRAARLLQYFGGALSAGFNMSFGPVLLASNDLTWTKMTGQSSARRATSTLVGVTLAAPVVLVFGALFTSADPVFDGLVRSAFNWDFASITSHLLLVGVVAWMAAGYMRSLVFGAPAKIPDGSSGPRLGIIEIGIPLVALIVVFFVFGAVQARYLFGGEELVQSAIGLTYAEYARRGFFELVTATTLVLPLLLAANWALDKHERKSAHRFRMLAVTLLMLVALIMDSALTRMMLYVRAYGLTADRLYATVFMGWTGVVFIWFAVTTLFGDGRRFAFGAIATGFAVLVGLNVLNPDRLIAHVNISRAGPGSAVDVAYLSHLSADAVPHIVPLLHELDEADACEFLEHAEVKWIDRGADWRSWNLGRARAAAALASDGASSFRRRCRSEPESPL